MTNSMNNVKEVIDLLHNYLKVKKVEEIHQYQVAFELNKEDIHQALSILKNAGWIQLSYLSAVDWIDEGEFELIYILMNWDKAVHVQLRTRLNREDAVMPSIIHIFPNCEYYERECHEFFGVKFPGNPMYDKQLILEQWDDLPPLRKDFDPKAYSDKKFKGREYSDNHINLEGQASKQEKRDERHERARKLGKEGR